MYKIIRIKNEEKISVDRSKSMSKKNLTDNEIEILSYELQWVVLKLDEIIKKLPRQYHDLHRLSETKIK